MHAVALVADKLDGELIEGGDLGCYAVELAVAGWAVFPLNGKVPAIAKRLGGNGVLDATTNLEQVIAWWAGAYKDANIGVRVPPSLAVLDVDPRHGGDLALAGLVDQYGPLPETLTVVSGRGDGGRHYYFRRPFAPLSVKALAGVDIKTNSGYVVAPPSLHPDTGSPYRWERSIQPAPMPRWLQAVLSPQQTAPHPPARPSVSTYSGASVADRYSTEARWLDLLPRHGWRLVRGDGDSDGSCWRHPTATSPVSATVTHSCLFVYSPNTPFEVTETDQPHGVTRFRALAILDFGGDMSSAARAVRERVR